LLQAAIAAEHARAATPRQTHWSRIAELYDALQMMQPSSVIALNRAAAIAMARGCEEGLALMDGLGRSGELERYHLYHAARADLLRRLGRKAEAADAYRGALGLTTNRAERLYLERRLREVSGGGSNSVAG
jgi:RNA polymerase sigma-70 factor (ECF subfamily)